MLCHTLCNPWICITFEDRVQRNVLWEGIWEGWEWWLAGIGDYSFLQEASQLTVIRCTLSSFHSANSLQQQLCYHFYCREHGAFRLKNNLPRDSERKLLTKAVSGSGCRCRIWDLERNKLEKGKDLDYFINSCSMFLLFSLIKKNITENCTHPNSAVELRVGCPP